MELGILKIIRLIVPAAIIIVFAKLLGFITGWWTTTIPDFEKAQYIPSVIVPAVIYYITPLRQWINAPHHRRISEKLRSGLVQITGYPDQQDKYTWKKLRPAFFSLIDQDESLKKKATLAYSNGAIWTSFADATALSVLFFLASILLLWLRVEHADIAAIAFVITGGISFIGSIVCTRKQIEIGAEQLEIIEYKYKTDVEKRLNSLDK